MNLEVDESPYIENQPHTSCCSSIFLARALDLTLHGLAT